MRAENIGQEVRHMHCMPEGMVAKFEISSQLGPSQSSHQETLLSTELDHPRTPLGCGPQPHLSLQREEKEVFGA